MIFYIFFTKRDAFISNCIAKATGSKVSHTGIITGLINKNNIILSFFSRMYCIYQKHSYL